MKRMLFPAALLAAFALAGCGPNRGPENTGNSSTELDGRNLQAPDSTVHPADNTTTPLNSSDDDTTGRDKGTGHRGILENSDQTGNTSPATPADETNSRSVDPDRGTGSGPGGVITGSKNTKATSPTSGNGGNGNVNSVEAIRKKQKEGGQ